MLAALSYPTVVKVHLGPFSISPHGVGIAVGFLAGARLLLPEAERKGIPEDQVYPLLIRAFVGAMVGARLAYVLNHLTGDLGYLQNPLDIFKVWNGGISLLGGFVGAILFALPAVRSRRIDFWTLMDAAAPGMALGVIIGRIGDLIVGDHLGTTTSLFFGFECPTDVTSTASDCLPGPGAVVHQTALYDLVLTSALLATLLYLRKHRPRYPGFLIMLFGAWYGCQRILEDFLREDKSFLWGLTGSQCTAIVTVVVCVWHLVFVRHTPRWGRWAQAVPAEAASEGEPVPADTSGTAVPLPEPAAAEPAGGVGDDISEPATTMPSAAEAVEARDEE